MMCSQLCPLLNQALCAGKREDTITPSTGLGKALGKF